MKIAILFPKDSEALFNKNSSRTFGGASVQLYNIAKELGNHDSVEAFSFLTSESDIVFAEKDSFNFVQVFSEQDSTYLKFVKLSKQLKEKKIDYLIQRGLTPFSPFLSLFCRIKGVKFVFMFASDVESRGRLQSFGKKCYFFGMLLRYSFRLIVQNSYQQSKIPKKYLGKTFLIKSGFFLKDEPEMKNKKKILWVSRCDTWKRPELFMELASQYPSENFVMICPYSVNVSAEYYEEIKNTASLIENLEFLEFVKYDEIDSYFAEAKLFVNTSDYEGFPQTFVQSTMNAVPILSLNVNPNGILSKHGCGFCAEGDFDLMAEKMSELVSGSTFKWKSMSAKCLTYAKENHCISKNVSKLLEALR